MILTHNEVFSKNMVLNHFDDWDDRMIERLICAITGHRYVVERILNPRTRKVGCTRCFQSWAMHDPTRSFVRWDLELDELYRPGGLLDEGTEHAA